MKIKNFPISNLYSYIITYFITCTRNHFITFLRVFAIIASPFILLTFSNLFIPINIELTFYGYVFSFMASLYYSFILREDRIRVTFNNRELYINKLISSLQNLGYVEKSREGLLTTFVSLDTYFKDKKILVYIYKDSALIIAPKIDIRHLNLAKQPLPLAIYRFFA